MDKPQIDETMALLQRAADCALTASTMCVDTYVVMDKYNRVLWKTHHGREVYSAIGYDLRPMCMSTDFYADQLDGFTLVSSTDPKALELAAVSWPSSGVEVRRLDLFFLEVNGHLLDTIQRLTEVQE